MRAFSELAGFRVLRCNLAESADVVVDLGIAERSSTVFTVNVDHMVIAERDPYFKSAYQDADAVFADGQPVVWLAKLVGEHLPERVTGADLFPLVATTALKRGMRVAIVGATRKSARIAMRQLLVECPGGYVRWVPAPQGFEPRHPAWNETVDELRRFQPHITFIALGSPRQEIVAKEMKADSGISACFIGVGAAVDFYSGEQSRAPKWLQQVGLEWFYRLIRDPERLWRRYLLRDMAFVFLALREWRAARARGGEVDDGSS